jgi:hypothetical protein
MSKIHNVIWLNLAGEYKGAEIEDYDFVLGWGAFGSPADNFMQGITGVPKGLCLAGNAVPVPTHVVSYQIIFYETDWIKDNYLKGVGVNLVKAFGVNTEIFKKGCCDKIWDYLSVGSFSYWKRLDKMKGKQGSRKICVGEVQKDNLVESMDIVRDLITNGVVVTGMIVPETLNLLYNSSINVYVPADINGGGERTVLEARSCGCNVEVEPDNPKLQELLTCDLPDEKVYFNALNSAICEYS